MFDNEFIKYANHEELEFIIFDDEVKLDANEFGNNFSDWIGSAKLKYLIIYEILLVSLYSLYLRIQI